jgi:hypothetical protein
MREQATIVNAIWAVEDILLLYVVSNVIVQCWGGQNNLCPTEIAFEDKGRSESIGGYPLVVIMINYSPAEEFGHHANTEILVKREKT